MDNKAHDFWDRLKYDVTTDKFGYIRYKQDGKLHRENGPAYIGPDNKKVWYKHGKCHREDGPAVTWGTFPDEYESWWINGACIDGIREKPEKG